MALPPEELERLRKLGRERRSMSGPEARRMALNRLGIVDTGMMTDEEVVQALAVYRAAMMGDEEFDGSL